MNVIPAVRSATSAVLTRGALAILLGTPLAAVAAQDAPAVARIAAEPASISIRMGETAKFTLTAYDAAGRAIAAPQLIVAGARGGLSVTDSTVRGLTAGRFDIVVSPRPAAGGRAAAPGAATITIPVTVTWPAVSRIAIDAPAGALYAGTTVAHRARALHADASARPAATFTWRSSAPAVASVDRFGNVTAHRPGAATITAESEGVTASRQYTVAVNPVARIDMGVRETSIRTGDVIPLVATARRANGTAVADAPITWSYTYTPDDTTAAPGGPGIIDNGRFAANAPGRFTLLAHSGNVIGRTVVEVAPRDVRRRITVTGRGNINSTHTADLWPWTGKDGRDYCIVGTWGGDGWAIVFDITDMNNIVKTDSVRIDARTINDVTVSPDGRYAALSREGASNRVNGVVILDLANPAHPKVAATFDQELTGGVHNMFATNDHLFAISGGQKYVIIDVKDISKPRYVSEYRHPDARIHDLWVHEGIAYSAQGGVGAVIVDVGNGKYGGTIERPKLITTFPIRSGHEIFPYFQKATGKVYLFLGDEEMSRQGRVWEGSSYSAELRASDGPVKGGVPQTSGGYTHIVDFTDPMNPRKVARYHLEDYGSHDIIVQDDILYQAYYDGGVRIVDVSGELMGNLADQRREIAVYKPFDPQGFTPNAPFVMNAMPWKGQVLFTDFNTGLWSAKLEPKRAVVP